MSSRMFQSVIVQMKEATVRTLGVTDYEGNVIACSDLSIIGSSIDGITAAMETAGDRVVLFCGRSYKILGNSGKFEYAVFVDGCDELSHTLCVMAGVVLNETLSYYEERNDKCALIRKIITDNILPGDVYAHAKELHFNTDAIRAVFLVRQSGRVDVALLDALRKLFPDRQKEFVVNVNDRDVAVIKEVTAACDAKEMTKLARQILETTNQIPGIRASIGISTLSTNIRDLAERFKEAQTALDVGGVFEPDKKIIHFESLGIGRLIYQLPTTLCEMFLTEVFKKSPIGALDEETLEIIDRFFENNLNISETSRKLFVHRNTLVYRLGKIKKITGLDLREFDQAIVFKVALMVKRYLDSQEQ